MTFDRFLNGAGRVLALIVGVQIFLWILSGFVMSWLPGSLVRGETTAGLDFPVVLSATTYAAPGGIIAQSEATSAVTLRYFLGKPVYETEGPDGPNLFDAETGQKLSPLDKDTARRLALRDYLGTGELTRLTLLTRPPRDFQGRVPVWRADFDDDADTRLYLSPGNGATLARRNRYWRIDALFRRMHLWRYSAHGEAALWARRAASTAALIGFVTVAGFYFRGRWQRAKAA